MGGGQKTHGVQLPHAEQDGQDLHGNEGDLGQGQLALREGNLHWRDSLVSLKDYVARSNTTS